MDADCFGVDAQGVAEMACNHGVWKQTVTEFLVVTVDSLNVIRLSFLELIVFACSHRRCISIDGGWHKSAVSVDWSSDDKLDVFSAVADHVAMYDDEGS